MERKVKKDRQKWQYYTRNVLTDGHAVLQGPVVTAVLCEGEKVQRVRHTQLLRVDALVVVGVRRGHFPVIVLVHCDQHGHERIVIFAQLVDQVHEQGASQLAEGHTCGK